MDQGVVSASNFVTTMLVAKAVDATSFGVYMLLFSTVFILSSVSESLVAGPTRVLGIRSEAKEAREYLDSQVFIQLGLGGVLALGGGAVVASWFSTDLVTAIAFGCCIFFWQLQELTRALQLTRLRVRYLLWMDVSNHSVRLALLIAFISTGLLEASTAFFAISLGSAIVFLMGLRFHYRVMPGTARIKDAVKQNWKFGRWLLMESGVSLASTHFYIYFTALWVDIRAAGALGAVQVLLNALNVLMVGTVNVAGPIARLRLIRSGYDQWKRWLLMVGIALTGLALMVTGLLSVFAEPLLALLFRPEYAHYALLVPVLGAATVLRGPNTILAVAFRTAEKPEVGFAAKTVSAVVTFAAAYPLLSAWGLYGAALGIVVTQLCWTVVYSRYLLLKGTLSRGNLAFLTGAQPA